MNEVKDQSKSKSQMEKSIEKVLEHEKYPSDVAKKRKVFPFIFTEQSQLYVEKLNKQQQSKILAGLQQFVKEWKIHGTTVGKVSIHCLSDYFILVVVDESKTSLSGCGKDALFHCVEKLAMTCGLRVVEVGTVIYEKTEKESDAESDSESDSLRREENFPTNHNNAQEIKLAKCMRHRVGQCIANGEIVAQNLVFDMSISTLEDFALRFCRPAMRTWLARQLPSSETQQSNQTQQKSVV